MRKGRSQRKSRGSLPPLSTRPAGLADGPQVVVGLTAPRSEEFYGTDSRADSRAPSSIEARSERAESQAPSKLEVLAEPTLELVREAERLELVREQTLEIDQESLDAESAEISHRVESAVETAIETAVSEPVMLGTSVQPLTSVEATESAQMRALSEPDAEPVLVSASAEPLVIVPPELVEHEADDVGQLYPEAPVAHMTALPTPDEMSIPPAGDLSVEPMADRFFSEGELAASSGLHDDEEWNDVAQKAQRKLLPEVVQRRARFARYVRFAVGGAAVVCLAALARTTLVPSRVGSASAVRSDVHAAGASPLQAAVEPAIQPPSAKAATPAVVAPVATEPAVAATAAAVNAEPAEPVVAAATAPAAPPPEAAKAEPAAAAAEPAKAEVAASDKTALQEKNDARRSLERGKLVAAIEAGERSVALDPTDGEAWLLLGAAYQEKGRNADARRAYASCLKEGKRGPLGECRAMIR